jgi:hypothetical protein
MRWMKSLLSGEKLDAEERRRRLRARGSKEERRERPREARMFRGGRCDLTGRQVELVDVVR